MQQRMDRATSEIAIWVVVWMDNRIYFVHEDFSNQAKGGRGGVVPLLTLFALCIWPCYINIKRNVATKYHIKHHQNFQQHRYLIYITVYLYTIKKTNRENHSKNGYRISSLSPYRQNSKQTKISGRQYQTFPNTHLCFTISREQARQP